jgi:hypothetical protein
VEKRLAHALVKGIDEFAVRVRSRQLPLAAMLRVMVLLVAVVCSALILASAHRPLNME